MDSIQILTWVMTTAGFTGFILAGRKIWWAWYINLAVQVLWAIYALATGQPAFLASAVAYFVIFATNAYKWTKDHRDVKNILDAMEKNVSGTYTMPGGVTVTYSVNRPEDDDDGMIIHNTKLDGSKLYTIPDKE